VEYFDSFIALFTQYWFSFGSKIQFHCRFVEYFHTQKTSLISRSFFLFNIFLLSARSLPNFQCFSNVCASLCLSVIYMMLRFNYSWINGYWVTSNPQVHVDCYSLIDSPRSIVFCENFLLGVYVEQLESSKDVIVYRLNWSIIRHQLPKHHQRTTPEYDTLKL
jgi:hypothetical protein